MVIALTDPAILLMINSSSLAASTLAAVQAMLSNTDSAGGLSAPSITGIEMSETVEMELSYVDTSGAAEALASQAESGACPDPTVAKCVVSLNRRRKLTKESPGRRLQRTATLALMRTTFDATVPRRSRQPLAALLTATLEASPSLPVTVLSSTLTAVSVEVKMTNIAGAVAPQLESEGLKNAVAEDLGISTDLLIVSVSTLHPPQPPPSQPPPPSPVSPPAEPPPDSPNLRSPSFSDSIGTIVGGQFLPLVIVVCLLVVLGIALLRLRMHAKAIWTVPRVAPAPDEDTVQEAVEVASPTATSSLMNLLNCICPCTAPNTNRVAPAPDGEAVPDVTFAPATSSVMNLLIGICRLCTPPSLRPSLQLNDRILSVNGISVCSAQHASELIKQASGRVELIVNRRWSSCCLTVQISIIVIKSQGSHLGISLKSRTGTGEHPRVVSLDSSGQLGEGAHYVDASPRKEQGEVVQEHQQDHLALPSHSRTRMVVSPPNHEIGPSSSSVWTPYIEPELAVDEWDHDEPASGTIPTSSADCNHPSCSGNLLVASEPPTTPPTAALPELLEPPNGLGAQSAVEPTLGCISALIGSNEDRDALFDAIPSSRDECDSRTTNDVSAHLIHHCRVPLAKVPTILAVLDANGNGSISREEWHRGWGSRQEGGARTTHTHDLTLAAWSTPPVSPVSQPVSRRTAQAEEPQPPPQERDAVKPLASLLDLIGDTS